MRHSLTLILMPCPRIPVPHITGETGLGKRQAAMDVIAQLMGCGSDELYKNPDFFLLDRQQDTIKVEDVLALLDKSSLAALKGKSFFWCAMRKI